MSSIFLFSLDEVNLKGGDEFNNIQKILEKFFQKDTSVQGLTSYFQKIKIEIKAIMGLLNKSDKDKVDKLDNSDYNQFIKKVYSDWDFISGIYTLSDSEGNYQKKDEGLVCKDYCYFKNEYHRIAFFPKNDKEHVKVLYFHLKYDSIPIIQTVEKERCWKVFIFKKCETENVEVMRMPDQTAFKAVSNYINKMINSDNFKSFLEQIEFIKDRSIFVNTDVIRNNDKCTLNIIKKTISKKLYIY